MMVLKGSSHPWQWHYFWLVSVFKRFSEIPSYTVREIKCCKENCTWKLLFLFHLQTFDIFLSVTVGTALIVTSTTEIQSPLSGEFTAAQLWPQCTQPTSEFASSHPLSQGHKNVLANSSPCFILHPDKCMWTTGILQCVSYSVLWVCTKGSSHLLPNH